MSRPRITHVVATDAFAGVERYVCDTVTELHRREWQVSVIGGDPEAMYAALPSGVRHQPAGTALRAAGALGAARTDLVHTHMTAAEAAAAPLKGLRYDRLVTTRHFARARGSSTMGRLARPLIERRLDAQISISSFVADSIGERSIVLPNGVPTSVLAASPRDRTVVVMQRMEPEKDTALALRAFAASGLQESGWRLVVYGRGSQAPHLQQVARELSLDVDFAGFTRDPRSVLSHAGVVLAPAPAEPFGLTVVEAMAEGAAVAASDGGAHLETLGPDGVFFAVGDVAAASEALRTLATEPGLAEAYGAALQGRQRDLFSIRRHVDRLEEIYTEVWDR